MKQQNKTTTVGKKTIDTCIALCEYKPWTQMVRVGIIDHSPIKIHHSEMAYYDIVCEYDLCFRHGLKPVIHIKQEYVL
jgi:hypothetical protein